MGEDLLFIKYAHSLNLGPNPRNSFTCNYRVHTVLDLTRKTACVRLFRHETQNCIKNNNYTQLRVKNIQKKGLLTC